MELNDYTKKIIRRLAIAIASFGLVMLAVGIYAYDLALMFAAVMLIVAAFTGYGVGKSATQL